MTGANIAFKKTRIHTKINVGAVIFHIKNPSINVGMWCASQNDNKISTNLLLQQKNSYTTVFHRFTTHLEYHFLKGVIFHYFYRF